MAMMKDVILTITEKVSLGAMENAKKYVPDYVDTSSLAIVQDVIEKYLIFRPVESDSDLEDAFRIAQKLGFSDMAEWVSYTLRRITEPHLKTCFNCNYFEEDNYYCPINSVKVNPWFCEKPCFAQKKD